MIGILDFHNSCEHSKTAHRLGIALLACLIVNLMVFASTTIATVLFPYGVDYGEAPLIDQAKRIIAGQTLYKATLDEPPYVIANYPPLYPLLIAGIGAITRLPFLQVGRIISLLAALVSGLIVGWFAYRLSGSEFSGLLAATLFLGNPFVMRWSSIARVDLLALALSLLALWMLYTRWHSWPWLAGALICLLASICTRQTYALAAPMAGAIWLWHHDRRRALLLIALLILACLSLFGLLNFVTRGGFYLNVVVANMNRYRVSRTLAVGAMLLRIWPIVFAIAGVEMARILKTYQRGGGRRGGGTAERPLLRYGLMPYSVGAFLSALTVGKIGSNVNYFLELMAALAIWIAAALAWQPERKTSRQRTILLLTLCQVAWVLGASLWLQSAMVARWRDLAKYDELYRQVKAATVQGPVLADDYLDMVVRAGQRIYLQPFEYQQLNEAGIWDPSALIEEIRAQRFPLILLNRPGSAICAERWAPPVIAAIEENYEGIERLPGLVAYRPVGLDSAIHMTQEPIEPSSSWRGSLR